MTSRLIAISASLVLASCTCGGGPSLDGRIVDPWGHSVADVEIRINGEGQPAKTGAEGTFAIKSLKTGAYKLTAQRKGYITDAYEMMFDAENDDDTVTDLTMYPEPTSDGYHIVGPESYIRLPAEPVKRIGSEIKQFQGVESAGDVEIAGKNFRVVFHTPLKMDQIARLDIELHRLTFIGQTEVGTVDGREEVDLNLWVSDGKVPFEREARGSDDNYLFQIEELPSGTYAFVSMNMLNPKNDAFPNIAEAVRNVHTFTVN
jgi:hypothetical protein